MSNQQLTDTLRNLIEETSGFAVPTGQEQTSFLELGLDSLVLTQVASVLQRQFKVPLSFRQLIEDLPSLALLAGHIGAQTPASSPPPKAEPAPPPPRQSPPSSGQGSQAPLPQACAPARLAQPTPAVTPVTPPRVGSHAAFSGSSQELTEMVIVQQLQVMQQQLELLRGDLLAGPAPATVESELPATVDPAPPVVSLAPPPAAAPVSQPAATTPSAPAPAKAFGPQVRIDLTTTEADLSQKQKDFLADFSRRYIERTRRSKEFTAKNRSLLADPRVVSGFKPVYKEMVYPLVVDRSSGSKLWDIDGNQLVDVTCGFGAHFFGHTPDWVVDAVTEQLKKGMEIGPQTTLGADVAGLMRDLTGFDRVAFCNTGSEAVLGATRLCRTVTGRPLLVMFENDYHGIFDEVVVRGSKNLRSRPAAAGITPEAVQNTLILDYGAPESLEILKTRLDDVAAVLVEPVQGRRPELVPREFLVALRELTEKSSTPLIFDEIITGFRIALGGAQEYFGIRADLATYGKIVGAGMPLAMIAGKAKYMDALDGGAWQYGDDSAPRVGVTYFAGTFVRHPPALAAARAALQRLKADGGQFHKALNATTDAFAAELNQFFEKVRAPVRIWNFGSLFKIWVDEKERHASLLWFLLRHHGVHVWEGRNCFLTLGHTSEDVQFLVNAFKASVRELIEIGLLSGDAGALASIPPVPGARLGRDPHGDPAWYVPDPQRPGKYLKVDQP